MKKRIGLSIVIFMIACIMVACTPKVETDKEVEKSSTQTEIKEEANESNDNVDSEKIDQNSNEEDIKGKNILPKYLCKLWYDINGEEAIDLSNGKFGEYDYEVVEENEGSYIIDVTEPDGYVSRYLISGDENTIMLYLYNEVNDYFTGGSELYSEDNLN